MAVYELPNRRWATAVSVAFVALIAATITALIIFAPKPEAPPTAEPAPAVTQPVEPQAPAAPEEPAQPSEAPAPAAPVSTVPEPKFTRDDLNLLGQSIWDAFGEDVVLVNGGVQYADANFNTKVIRPFDPAAKKDDEKPLNFEGSKWVIRVTETDPEKGTVWSIIT